MNKIRQAFLAFATTVALVSCGSSSTAPKSSGSSFNPFNPNISYGSLTDSRDEQAYKTVVIGTQTWMAQNLNYKPTTAPDSSWCSHDSASYCAIYGRLYDYATALTVCPTGWHLPDTTEWNTLEAYVGGTAGTKLKANSNLWSTNMGADNYGFSALPSGSYYSGAFGDVGLSVYFWTATASGSFDAWYRYMYCYGTDVYNGVDYHPAGLSVRCLKD